MTCTEKDNKKKSLISDQDNTSLIVAIAVPLALICILFVTIIFLRRRRNGGRKATKESRANDNMSLPDSVVETSRPILIKNFADHYRLMSADSDFRYETNNFYFLFFVAFDFLLYMNKTFFILFPIDSAKNLKN